MAQELTVVSPMLGINAALHATPLLQPTHIFVTLELTYTPSSSDPIAFLHWLEVFILLIHILWSIPYSLVTALSDIDLVHARLFYMFTYAYLSGQTGPAARRHEILLNSHMGTT